MLLGGSMLPLGWEYLKFLSLSSAPSKQSPQAVSGQSTAALTHAYSALLRAAFPSLTPAVLTLTTNVLGSGDVVQ